MKIVENKTHYDTRALRRLICEVHRRFAKHEGRLKAWKWLRVHVGYAKHDNLSGKANYAGTWMQLLLPPNKLASRKTADLGGRRIVSVDPKHDHIVHVAGRCDVQRLAYLIDHELYHSYGIGHDKMPKHVKEWPKDYNENYGWVVAFMGGEFLVHKEEKAPRPKPDVQRVRYDRVLERIDVWETKARRAKNALKKLKVKARYYEKTFEKKAAMKGVKQS